METNLKFNSAVCTSREQSERLLALGLKSETADMSYQVKFFDPFPQRLIDCTPMLLTYPPINNERFIPAWSLHRLIEMIPIMVPDKSGIDHFFTIDGARDISYYYFGEESWENWKSWNQKELYDNVIDCIEWLIEEGHLNKEYLEE